LALAFALPVSWGKLTGISNWLSPFIMLNSVLMLKSFVALNAIGILILVICWFKKLWFCNNLCPVGCLLDLLPKNKNSKRLFQPGKIPFINKWLVILSLTSAVFGIPLFIYFDPVAIFNSFFSSFTQPFRWIVFLSLLLFPLLLVLQFFSPGLYCVKLCPLGGLQFILHDLKNWIKGLASKTEKTDLKRRILIGGAAGAVTTLLLSKMLVTPDKPVIRPPGSINFDEFNLLCIRCGSCIKSCPTNILERNTDFGLSMLTPVVRFHNGYCLESCNNCSRVCPTGSITSFSIKSKKDLKMGRCLLNLKDCLLIHGKECGKCRTACSYHAINLVHTTDHLNSIPELNDTLCVGCGACLVICPVDCFKIV
jgi:ferredoxin-type protein NapF